MHIEKFKRYERLFAIFYALVVVVVFFLLYKQSRFYTTLGFGVAVVYVGVSKVNSIYLRLTCVDYKNRVPILYSRYAHYLFFLQVFITVILLVNLDEPTILGINIDGLLLPFFIICMMTFMLICEFLNVITTPNHSSRNEALWYIYRVNDWIG